LKTEDLNNNNKKKKQSKNNMFSKLRLGNIMKGTMLRSRVLDFVLSAISVMVVDGVTAGSLIFDAI
jgi:hypothetical protein